MDDVSRRLLEIFILITALVASGCASTEEAQKNSEAAALLQQQLKEAQQEIAMWRSQADSILQRAADSCETKPHPSSENITFVEAKALPSQLPQKQVENQALSGEHLLYSNLIGSYRHNQFEEAERSMLLLLKAYPKSVHADNALLLVAQIAGRSREPSRALHYLDLLVNEYPLGNKVSAALLEKGRILGQLNQKKRAKKVLSLVIKKFPGSLEALAANRELEQI